MIECIKNLNFEKSINKDEIFNLFKTKSNDINFIIQSKINSSKSIFDFFHQYTNIDITSISNSINYLNNQFSTFLNSSSKNFNENVEIYIYALSTIILVIHYCLKIKTIVSNKLKEIQQSLIAKILNNKLEEPYKDKIIEYSCLSNYALSHSEQKDISFSDFTDNNKSKIYNHFDSSQSNFNENDPTPKFFLFEKESPSFYNKNSKNQEIENKVSDCKNQNKYNKPSCSSISMSSILVLDKIPKEKKNIKKNGSLNRFENHFNQNKKNIKENENLLSERKVVSDKYLDNNTFNKEDAIKKTLFNIKISKKSINSCMEREINNSENKDLFIKLMKFTNELYKDKYIDENQKKNLKQLIIKYINLKK